jgi:probable rRNA maturation factor
MKLNIYNWTVLKKHFPNISFSKKDLQEVLFKKFSKYDLNNIDNVNDIKKLNVVFVFPKDIKQLNKDFRKKDTVTDVLSFVLEQDPLIGEIYICPEYVAKKYNYEEVLRVIVHGFLHLLGYEHTKYFIGKHTSKNGIQEDMFVKQENMLQNILYEINNRPG